jgi:hypothetical protein
MRHLAIALGLCLTFGLLSSPLAAAQGSPAHGAMLVKAKRNKSKFKPHKATKRHARRANRAN